MIDVEDDSLQALEQLTDAATEGPWCLRITHAGVAVVALAPSMPGRTRPEVSVLEASSLTPEQMANWEFMAAAREAVPMLIAEIRRLRRGGDGA